MAEQKKPAEKAGKFPMYKDKPLVRVGDTIYYGDMKDPYVINMEIKSKKTVNGEEIADKILVRLMSTDTSLPMDKQVIKTSEKSSLYLAMDIAEIWLERYLEKSEKTKSAKKESEKA